MNSRSIKIHSSNAEDSATGNRRRTIILVPMVQSYFDWSKVVVVDVGLLDFDPRISAPREIPIYDQMAGADAKRGLAGRLAQGLAAARRSRW